MAVLINKNDLWFPPIDTADEDGLVALTQDFSMERILLGYQSGVFPWFTMDNFFWWFAPNPRCVIFPNEVRITKSMQQVLNGKSFEFKYNCNFLNTMQNCANTKRKPVYMEGVLYPNDSTWITQEYFEAYTALHQLGFSISAETWQNGEMVGGLYGVLIGKVFFGESMFSVKNNASKFAFFKLVEKLKIENDLQLIDCQQPTPHIMSLGARRISCSDFKILLDKFIGDIVIG